MKDSRRRQHSRKKKGVTSERKARELEFQFKNELHQLIKGGYLRWTWREWHQECLKQMGLSYKASTVQGYDGGLKKWLPKEFVEKYLEDINVQDIRKFLFEAVGDRVSKHYQNNLLKMVKRIFEMAVEEGVLAKNPALSIKVKVPQAQKKVLNAQEAGTLLEEACKCQHRFYKIWAFALMTGMRSGEMFAMRWQDIDMETGLISVNKQWTSKDGIAPPKNRENRMVPINDDLSAFLRGLRAKQESHFQEFWDIRSQQQVTFDDLLLPRLKEWENGEQARVLRAFCRAVGITVIRFHDLRATFITNMLAHGVPLVKVMAIVGHRRMSTTDEYLRLAGVNIHGATQKVGYRLPQPDVTDNVLPMPSSVGVKFVP